MATLLRSLFGCPHKRTTFPMTRKSTADSAHRMMQQTYIVCLDCGEEFAYDWQKMKRARRTKEADVVSPAA